MAQWAIGLCSVIFDLDIGPKVDAAVLDDELALTAEERAAIAFHAFPDSLSMELHAKTSIRDTSFFFRIKRSPATATTAGNSIQSSAVAPVRYIYGWVFCRQRQDESLRRGGEQISVIVLSEHPYSSVLRPLSQVAGPLYFSMGPAALQQVYQEVKSWPPPTAGPLLQLQVGFANLSSRLPPFNTLPHPSCLTAVDTGSLGRHPSTGSIRSNRSRMSGPIDLTQMGAGGSGHLPATAPGLTGSGQLAQVPGGLDVSGGPHGSQQQGFLLGRPSHTGDGQGEELTYSGSFAAVLDTLSPQGTSRAGSLHPSRDDLPGLAHPSPGGSAGGAGPAAAAGSGGGAAHTAAQGGGAGSGGGAGGTAKPAPRTSQSSGLFGWLSGAGPSGSAGTLDVKVVASSNGKLSEEQASELTQAKNEPVSQQQQGSQQGHTESTAAVPGRSTPPVANGVVRPPSAPLPPHMPGATGSGTLPPLAPSHSNPAALQGMGSGTSTSVLAGQGSGGLGQHQSSAAGQGGAPSAGSLNSNSSGPLQLPRRLSLSSAFATEGAAAASATAGHGAFSEMDLYTPLAAHLNKLWHLWELVLLAKPLLVVAPSPADCSSAVAALISLIAPLPYRPDFRPYYTIHDPAFGALANGVLPAHAQPAATQQQPVAAASQGSSTAAGEPQQPCVDEGPKAVPCLMGITNLYFLRALPQWPNILSVGLKEVSGAWASQAGSGAAGAAGAGAATSLFTASGAVKVLRQRAQGAQSLLSEHTQALWSGYRPVTRPDTTLLTRLLQPKKGDVRSKVTRIAYVNSEALRRHFHDLTAALLSPFARYFEAGPDGYLPDWDESEFLFALRAGSTGRPVPPVLLERVGASTAASATAAPPALVELYARFVRSPNFAAYFAQQRAGLQHLVRPAPPPQSQGKAGGWFPQAKKHIAEVELIGLFFSLESQLRDALTEAGAPDAPEEAEDTVARLQRELVTLFLGIGQQDLQLICISAPQRRDLLFAAADKVLTPVERAGLENLVKQLI